MQGWIVKHVSRDGLYLREADDYFVTGKHPTVFLECGGDAHDACKDMDVPEDWKVVEVEITEK